MVDLSELVQLRPQPAEDIDNDIIANGNLVWQCESYDEYQLRCTVEGIEPLYTRREFDEMKQPMPLAGVLEVAERHGVDIATVLGVEPRHVNAINL